MSYQSKRLKYELQLALGASRDLRRLWFWGCWLLMLVCALVIWLLMPYELGPTVLISNLAQITMFLCVGGIGLSLAGLGMWVIACIIGFVGRYVKTDYENGTLFD